jgi:hypothetical protein
MVSQIRGIASYREESARRNLPLDGNAKQLRAVAIDEQGGYGHPN